MGLVLVAACVIGVVGEKAVTDAGSTPDATTNPTPLPSGDPIDGDTSDAPVDAGIDAVSATRATFGAIQNRLEHAGNAAASYAENLTAAESRIRDVDMADEMINFSKNQILSQAGTSMLSQANQASQSVLSLLR